MIEMEDIPITKEEYIAMVKTINQLRKEKQHLIDKACEWLKSNHDEIYLRYIRGYSAEDEIEIFKKHMEERQ